MRTRQAVEAPSLPGKLQKTARQAAEACRASCRGLPGKLQKPAEPATSASRRLPISDGRLGHACRSRVPARYSGCVPRGARVSDTGGGAAPTASWAWTHAAHAAPRTRRTSARGIGPEENPPAASGPRRSGESAAPPESCSRRFVQPASSCLDTEAALLPRKTLFLLLENASSQVAAFLPLRQLAAQAASQAAAEGTPLLSW